LVAAVLVLRPSLIKLTDQVLYLAISLLLAAALVVIVTLAAVKQVTAAVAAVAAQPIMCTTSTTKVLILVLPITVVMALRGKVMLVVPQQ
jgi:hypothetical protein